MEEEILSTSNFKYYLLFLILGILSCTSSEWYRKLPETRLPESKISFGKWKKDINPRMPMNSAVYKDTVTEFIYLNNDFTFRKIYKTTLSEGNNKKIINMEGTGSFELNGNWVLFELKKLKIEEFENNSLKIEKVLEKDNRLLYYFWKKENLIIPMIYEKAFEEKDFGVKDGVSRPYDESEKNLYNFIKIYAFKEFQSHAYFYSGEK